MMTRRELENQLTSITELADKRFIESKELKIKNEEMSKELQYCYEIISTLQKSVMGLQEKIKTFEKKTDKSTNVFVITYKFYAIVEGKKKNLTAKISVTATNKKEALKEFTKLVNGEPIAVEKLDLGK